MIQLVFFPLVIPVTLLLHEVGHGIGVVLTSKSNPHIYLGSSGEDNREDFQVGRFHFHLQWAYFGCCKWDGGMDKLQRFLCLLSGPLMNLFLMGITVLLLHLEFEGWPRTLLAGVADLNLVMLVINLIPFKLPKKIGSFQSDGLQLLRLLKERASIEEKI